MNRGRCIGYANREDNELEGGLLDKQIYWNILNKRIKRSILNTQTDEGILYKRIIWGLSEKSKCRVVYWISK